MIRVNALLLTALSALTLSACAEIELASHVAKKIPIPDNQQSAGYFKVGKPYKIKGQWYRPKETYSFEQTGVASWYGPNFHGKKTANGETFDMYELTAAHKTLQMPSMVRVTNLENGKSIIVRVNDRGPFSRGRIIDLSKRSAQLLGFEHQGTARVKIQVLGDESRQIADMAKKGFSTNGTEIALNQPKATPRYGAHNPPPAEPVIQSARVAQPAVANNNIYVQAGAFSNHDNAQKLVQSLRSFGQAKVHETLRNGKPFYRVRFGPMQNTQKADMLLARLGDSGRANAIVIVD